MLINGIYAINGKPPQKRDFEIALNFALQIISHMVEKKDRPIEYAILAIKVNRHEQTLGPYLGLLVSACHTLGLPLISSIVVYKKTQYPSSTFYELVNELGYSGDDYMISKEAVYKQKQWWELIKILEEKIISSPI